ncbi:MAG: hypothetical protein E7351_03335 [Clostridiales bacterium]|nr:hypothetical protein [Clostridiales bacterium]
MKTKMSSVFKWLIIIGLIGFVFYETFFIVYLCKKMISIFSFCFGTLLYLIVLMIFIMARTIYLEIEALKEAKDR